MPHKTKDRKVQLPTMQMRADFSPATIDKEKRTVELIWTTGKKGLRRTWDESYFEELSMDPNHVRMGRMESGASPLLDNHDRNGGNASVVGVVEKAWLENGMGKARVRFADTPDVADLWRKVETGILKNVSVGYSVYKYERQPEADGEEAPTYRAVDWEPTEISIVPVGFDEHAVVRGKDDVVAPCVFVDPETKIPMERNEEVEMTEEQKKQLELERKAAEEKATAEKALAMEKARSDEKARQTEIRSICKKMSMPEAFVTRMIEEDKSVELVRELVIDEKAKESDANNARNTLSATGGKPALLNERKLGLENAMLHRAGPGSEKLTEAGRYFRGKSLMEMGRNMLEAGGVNTDGMGKMELATRLFHSSSDFPEVLANVANKSLRKGYDEAPRSFLPWAKAASIPDFKQVSRTQLGEAPSLEIVDEDGEIKRGTIGEGAEKYTLATYAKIVGITRKVIINDDLGAFTSMAQKFGFAAASLESDVVYAILTANAALGVDSVALFHSTHANLGTAGVPSITTLGELRKLIRLQKGLDGVRPLNLLGKFGIFPAALEVLALQLVAQTTPAQASQVNPISFVPIIEPRLDAASATAYYMAADSNQVDTVEYGYLEGQEGVYTETRQGFDVDGMEVKARLDFAAKAIDFRGLAKNLG